MNIEKITTENLRCMKDQEGLILQGCGGDLNEWVDGINQLLTANGCLRDGTQFQKVSTFDQEGLTCLLFHFTEDMKLNVGKLAAWRLASHEQFGGTWLSDFVPKRLGGFARDQPEKVQQKPDCPLIGADGNIFNLLGIASRTLKENWMEQFRPRFADSSQDHVPDASADLNGENAPTPRSADSRDWWSDSYKMARRFVYGTKEEKPDFQKTMSLLLMEANCGNGYACYDVGRMHLLGLGCEKNEEEAQRWFRDALDAFYMAEQAADRKAYLRYRIGKCHASGHGTEQNYEKSARWFQQAVEDNNPFAAYSLGGQYLRGQGVTQSDKTAFNLFRLAATHPKQPNAYAQYQLGRMCRDGIGTEKKLEESKLWFAKAYAGFLTMEKTMADDKLYYRLGSMNCSGTGTEVNLEQAKLYFEKAVELGNTDVDLVGVFQIVLFLVLLQKRTETRFTPHPE